MTHCRSVVEKPSARCADGSAMFTMVASSTTISWAIPMTARTSHRRCVRPAGPPGPAPVAAPPTAGAGPESPADAGPEALPGVGPEPGGAVVRSRDSGGLRGLFGKVGSCATLLLV